MQELTRSKLNQTKSRPYILAYHSYGDLTIFTNYTFKQTLNLKTNTLNFTLFPSVVLMFKGLLSTYSW